MSIFITGIESFLGKFLVKSLIKRKFVFSGIDLLAKSDFAKKYDINDHNLKNVIPDDCKSIIHLAAISSSKDFKTDVQKAYATNINGTINIVKAAIEKNVKQIIFASTEWVYGEDKSGRKNESSHIYFENLGSEYALSKAICENILKYYCSLNNINCTILRFGITYGPRQNKNNWSAVESILYDLFLGNTKITIGSKKTARKFIYAEDVSEGIIASMDMKGVKILNLSGDKLITLNEIIETGCKILNIKCKILEKDSNNFNVRDVDNNLVKNLTEWTPKYDFYSGVKNTIQSFKKLDKNIKLSTYKTPGSSRMDHAAND